MNIDTSTLTFGERVRFCRLIKKMTQDDLAKVTGISVRHIANYENDRSDPSLFNAGCIAKALGVSIDYLAGLTDEK